MDIIDRKLREYCPYIYFSENEVCYPIDINKFLPECELCRNTYFENKPNLIDSEVIDIAPSNNKLFNISSNRLLFLNYKYPGWEERLRGDPKDSYCYAVSQKQLNGDYWFIYFYLYSHTAPYRLCNCLCKLNSYSHRADIKFNAVIVDGDDHSIKGLYYGAHGSNAGEYTTVDKIEFFDTHPIVYVCEGDHSNYKKSGCFPRIFFTVYDKCYSDILSKPSLIRIYEKDDPNFNANTMGWLYFDGQMSPDGIGSPHNIWKNCIPINDSNNWFRRLFCCKYF